PLPDDKHSSPNEVPSIAFTRRHTARCEIMMRRGFPNSFVFSILGGLAILLLLWIAPGRVAAQPSPQAIAGFNSYAAGVEGRLARQHRSPYGFLAPVDWVRLRRGEPIVEQLTPSAGAALPGALLHDWRGTAFVPGATAADFERLMQNFAAYPQRFAPEVVAAKVLAHAGGRYRVLMRVRQHHVITVTLNTTYDVTFARLDAKHGYSISRSTKIAEIASPGTSSERALSPGEEHGFLWRLNTYWSYEEHDGGLYMQIESVSLTRSIPVGLGWAIGSFVESVPRDSLEFTLRSAYNALRK
ncbi:MAG: hypothetical protein ACRD27_07385, partial [Terracidiphilus sp.]